jgi:flavodoxin
VAYSSSIEQYDMIYLGFPNYWGTMPMPVFTFLEQCRLRGKRICLFCTHEGDGFGHSKQDVQRLCPGAIIEAGPAILGAHISEAQSIITKWISER